MLDIALRYKEMEIKIIYEDADILVCEKPAGFPVQSRRIGQKDCVSVLKTYLYKKEERKGEPYLGLIHRLDQPVEGLMAFAKTKNAAGHMSAQLSTDGFVKEYEAVVCGKMELKSGKLTDYLKKDGKMNCSCVVDKNVQGAKRAELEYRVLEEKDGYSLVAVRLITGRHHQIRVQMAHAGCPLCGDRKYGAPDQGTGGDSIGLCAARLSFLHPRTKKKMEFSMEPTGRCFAWFR